MVVDVEKRKKKIKGYCDYNAHGRYLSIQTGRMRYVVITVLAVKFYLLSGNHVSSDILIYVSMYLHT